MTIHNNETLNLVINEKTASEVCKLLKISPVYAQNFTLNIKVEKDEDEQFAELLRIVKDLGLEHAKGEFRMHNVANAHTCEGLAEIVWAERQAERKASAKAIKNFPSSKNIIEWRADGRIFVNGREGFLTSAGPNPGIMLASDK